MIDADHGITIDHAGNGNHAIGAGVAGDRDGGVIRRVGELIDGEVGRVREIRRRHSDCARALGVTAIAPTGEDPAIGGCRGDRLRGAHDIAAAPAHGTAIYRIGLHRDHCRRRRRLAHCERLPANCDRPAPCRDGQIRVKGVADRPAPGPGTCRMQPICVAGRCPSATNACRNSDAASSSSSQDIRTRGRQTITAGPSRLRHGESLTADCDRRAPVRAVETVVQHVEIHCPIAVPNAAGGQPVRAAGRRPRATHAGRHRHAAAAGARRHICAGKRQTVAATAARLYHTKGLATHRDYPCPIRAIGGVGVHREIDRPIPGSAAWGVQPVRAAARCRPRATHAGRDADTPTAGTRYHICAGKRQTVAATAARLCHTKGLATHRNCPCPIRAIGGVGVHREIDRPIPGSAAWGVQPVRAGRCHRRTPGTAHSRSDNHAARTGANQDICARRRQTIATAPDCLCDSKDLTTDGQSPNPIGAVASVIRHRITDRAVADSTAATGDRQPIDVVCCRPRATGPSRQIHTAAAGTRRHIRTAGRNRVRAI